MHSMSSFQMGCYPTTGTSGFSQVTLGYRFQKPFIFLGRKSHRET